MSFGSASSAQGEARRDEIVRVATDVFGQAGFAGARLDEVARRVGIRRPSILYHFPDKQALYAAALTGVVRDIDTRVRAIEVDAEERLDAIVDAWIDFVIERPHAARLILRQLIDSRPVPVSEIAGAVRALLEIVQAAIEAEAGPAATKHIEAGELSLILSSTSLVWVAGRSAVEGALGLDTLSPSALQRHRRMLHALIRQLLAAAAEADASQAASDSRDEHTRPGAAASPSVGNA